MSDSSDRIIDGKAFAEALRGRIGTETGALKAAHGLVPGLAVVLVGDDPASQVYVRNKGKAAEAAGIMIGLGHNQRYGAPQTVIKAMIDAGELGEIMHLEGNTSHDTLSNVQSWRMDIEEAPGGGLWHMGSHHLDLFQHYIGPITEVYAQAVDVIIPRDTASALLTFECGATAYIGNVMVTRDNRMGNVFGSKGWAKMISPTTVQVAMRGGDPKNMEVDPVDPVRANVEGFAAAIAGTEPYRFTNAQMIHDVAALDAIKLSLKSGKREAVAR